MPPLLQRAPSFCSTSSTAILRLSAAHHRLPYLRRTTHGATFAHSRLLLPSTARPTRRYLETRCRYPEVRDRRPNAPAPPRRSHRSARLLEGPPAAPRSYPAPRPARQIQTA